MVGYDVVCDVVYDNGWICVFALRRQESIGLIIGLISLAGIVVNKKRKTLRGHSTDAGEFLLVN